MSPATEDVSRKVMKNFGLRHAETSSQIIFRDSWCHLAQILAGIATWLEAIATEIRLLSLSMYREVHEDRTNQNQVGSSSMPHKENPIQSENLCSLARLARGYADALQLSQVQWFDRDLAHSAAERVALPDLIHVVDFMLVRAEGLVKNLEWQPEQMRLNAIDPPYGIKVHLSHERLTELVRHGMSRNQAYETVREELGIMPNL